MENKFHKLIIRKLLIGSFLLITFFLQAQSKSFVLIDSITEKPIDLVHLFYPDLDVGSITNADGKATIPLKKKRLLASHINYNSKSFTYEDFKQKDTIYLSQKNTDLDEVVVFNINLKDKIRRVLEAVEENYKTEKVIHNSTYKEIYRVNDSLSRLFQIQMDLWINNGLYNFGRPIDRQNRVAIESVDYSKTIQYEEGSNVPNGGYLENDDFFRFSYLNYLLILIQEYGKDIVLKSVQKEGDQISVLFDGTLASKEKKLFEYQNSRIVFDSTYTKIKFVKLNMIYDENFEKDFSKEKNIAYEKATSSHFVELSFEESKKGKMILNYVISEINALVRYGGRNSTISSKQSLFITESTFSKKLRGKKVLDLSQPFFKSLKDEQPTQNAKILLTNEEKNFLKKI